MPQKKWRRVDVPQRSVSSFLPGLAALAVETFLVFSARVGLIVLPATFIGMLATVMPPAAKGAAKITAARAARMSEEANPAVATAHGAVLPIRTIAQDSIQRELILTNKRKDPVVLMPILAKREKFRDGYNKTARFSVKMLNGFSMSSSYSLDAKASRGRARIFYA